YLAPWLHEHGLAEVRVVLGFEGSRAPSGTFLVTEDGANRVDSVLEYGALVEAARAGSDALSLVEGPSQTRFAAIPSPEQHDSETHHYSAFVLVPPDSSAAKDEGQRGELSRRVSEAIRSYRSNVVRILFEQQQNMPIKD